MQGANSIWTKGLSAITEEDSNTPVALITGSSSGIGLAIAHAFAESGYDCILHGGHSQEKLDLAVKELREFDINVIGLLADFKDPNSFERFVEQAWNWQGHIDAMVNNAGADLLTDNTDLSLPDKLQLLTDVDVRSTMNLSLAIGERMSELALAESADSGEYAICNIGWDQAEQGMEGESGVLFSISKGGIMSMTRSLAQSLAPQVRVNCVAPGWIQTAWGENASEAWQARAVSESLMNRWGNPDDVAEAVLFLCSPLAGFISGQILNVNGGFRYGPSN